MAQSNQDVTQMMAAAARAYLHLRGNPDSKKAMHFLQTRPSSATAKRQLSTKKRLRVRVGSNDITWSLTSNSTSAGTCSERTIREIGKLLLLTAEDGALAIIATGARAVLLERPKGKEIEHLPLDELLSENAYRELLQVASVRGTMVFELK